MNIPASTKPVMNTSSRAIARTFQNGRVSIRSYALLTALIIELIAPLAAQTAPKNPSTNASDAVRLPARGALLGDVDRVGDGARGDDAEELAELVVGADQAEQADERGSSPGRTRAAS